jgi:hypothetical protein
VRTGSGPRRATAGAAARPWVTRRRRAALRAKFSTRLRTESPPEMRCAAYPPSRGIGEGEGQRAGDRLGGGELVLRGERRRVRVRGHLTRPRQFTPASHPHAELLNARPAASARSSSGAPLRSRGARWRGEWGHDAPTPHLEGGRSGRGHDRAVGPTRPAGDPLPHPARTAAALSRRRPLPASKPRPLAGANCWRRGLCAAGAGPGRAHVKAEESSTVTVTTTGLACMGLTVLYAT